MATGGSRRIYKEDDVVDECFLNQLSKWILYHHLGALARDLGISQAEFSRIVTPFNTPEEQIFQVCLKWHHRTLLKVKDLVLEMVRWMGCGYLDRGVWKHFSSKINPVALPANIETLQLPAPPTGSHS